jgi:anti-anti-sigma factor
VTLEVASEQQEGRAVVRLSGELDLSTVAQAEAEVRRMEQEEPSLIVLDLRELEFIDSSGLRLVLQTDARAKESGRRLSVVPGNEFVQRVFHVMSLDQRLEFIEAPEDGR